MDVVSGHADDQDVERTEEECGRRLAGAAPEGNIPNGEDDCGSMRSRA